MKKITTIALALTLLGGSAALAQYNDNSPTRERGVTQQQNDREPTEQQDRNNNRRDNQGGRYQDQGQNNSRADERNQVQDNPHWSRGDKLPPQFHDRQNVVTDWRNNHLRRPPRGYHWVRVNDQYVLAAITSGVIADIILDNQRGR